ncbi:MAG: 50S ribosomal protein L10 [Candidatus Doudnabacteria bacterium]|nr:50S ribosomal protein L10 [Candidatus Doudnabacteria bacterium]
MPKSKLQKEQDLEELTSKLKSAKAVVLSDYCGTTVKDITKFRKVLREENVFSKVYKLTLVKKALEAAGIKAEKLDYKTPVILAVSEEDETTPARVIRNFSKDVKTISILEGVLDKAIISKAQVESLANLPSHLKIKTFKHINMRRNA